MIQMLNWFVGLRVATTKESNFKMALELAEVSFKYWSTYHLQNLIEIPVTQSFRQSLQKSLILKAKN